MSRTPRASGSTAFTPARVLHPLASGVTPLLFGDRKPGAGVGQLSEAACRRPHHFGLSPVTVLPIQPGSGSSAGSGAGTEVLRGDLVEELAELLDLVLLLVRDLDPDLVEQLFGPEDRRTGPHREGNRV